MEENNKEKSSNNDGMSISNRSFHYEKSQNENENNEIFSSHDSQQDDKNLSKNNKILKCRELFLRKKRRVLKEEEKKERTNKIIERYYKRNNKMLKLLDKINSKKITGKNINHMMHLLAIDITDSKKINNVKICYIIKRMKYFKN